VRFVEGRIARLDPIARRIAEAVAVLGEEADLRRTARIAGVEDDETVRVARDLTHAAILDAGTPLAFEHPIVRDAVYSAIPGVARARAHREAALLLLDDGVAIGVVGAQLLEAERAADPRIVAVLLDAAAQSVARGEPGVAIRLLTRALEEPPDRAVRSKVLVALARAEALVRSPMTAERYGEALSAADDVSLRASLLLELGHAQISAMDWRAATETFEQGMRELVSDVQPERLDAPNRELHERLEAGFLSSAWVSMDRRSEVERAMSRILAEDTLGRVHRELAVSVAFHRNLAVSASATELAALVRRAIEEAPIDQLITEGQTVEIASGVLLPTDEHALQVDLLSRGIEAAERTGAYGKVGIYAYCRAWPYYFTGRLDDAIADAQASLRIAELGWETFVPAARGVLAEALLEHGEPDAAREALAIDDAVWAHRVDHGLIIPLARGRLALAGGDVEGGLALLREAARVPTAAGIRATIPADWRVWTTVALARLGRRDEARALADETIGIAREWGARWTLGCALRVAGLAEGGPRGIELLHESVRLLDGSTARLEHARALVDLGAALRRAGRTRDARAILARAVDLTDRLAARLLLDRAAAELRAAGARPRRRHLVGRDALTPSELRVASLAAGGRTNREVAQMLFVTPKAVEFHLANAYQKLGIASRQDLAVALQPATPG
jgi:DNA-binding CsgD family transcriptional regulator